MRLVAENLSARRGGEPVIRGLSFTVSAGEALVVTGPNGVGKSTLLRVVAGLLAADTGDVRLDPLPPGAEALAEACHYLGHRNGMKQQLTVGENLSFWRDLMRRSGRPAVTVSEAAAAVGLEALLSLPYGYLSAGQQRRIAIARLLVARRLVWIVDEPTAGLDAQSEEIFAGLVDRHLEAGGLALIATHQPLAIKRQRQLALAPAVAAGA
jgi:heme exporter protein A